MPVLGLPVGANRVDEMLHDRHTAIAERVGRAALTRGQLDESTMLQFQQQRARRHVLDTTLAVAPVPQVAEFLAQPHAAPVPMLGHQPSDQPDLLGRNGSSLSDHALCHDPDHRKLRDPSPEANQSYFCSIRGRLDDSPVNGSVMVELPE